MQNSENLDTRIFGLTSTLEKPTRGKPMRGLFIIIELLRNFFYSIFIFRNLHKLIWTFFRKKILLNSPGKCSSISVPEIRTTVRLSQQLMLYKLSRNSCQNSAKIVRKTQHDQLLENRVVWPLKLCCTALDLCANKWLYDSLGVRAKLLRNYSVVSLNFCA
jgi:hypothetical protein